MDSELFVDISDDHFGIKKHWQVVKKRSMDPEIKGFQIYFSPSGVEDTVEELLQHSKKCWDLQYSGQYDKCIAEGSPVLPNIRRQGHMFQSGTKLHLDVHFAESLILFSIALSRAKRADYMNLWHPRSVLVSFERNKDLVEATRLIEEMFITYDCVGGPKRGILFDNALVDLGHVYHRRGLREIAISAYQKGIEFNPTQVVAHYHLGAIAYFERRFRDYHEHIKNALVYREDMSSQTLRNCLGSLALSSICLGAYDEAEQVLDELWPKYPDYVRWQFNEPNIGEPVDRTAFEKLKGKYRR